MHHQVQFPNLILVGEVASFGVIVNGLLLCRQTWVQVHLYLYLSTISTTPLVLEVVRKYFLCKVHILVLVLRV